MPLTCPVPAIGPPANVPPASAAVTVAVARPIVNVTALLLAALYWVSPAKLATTV